jgi:hypothetical protein
MPRFALVTLLLPGMLASSATLADEVPPSSQKAIIMIGIVTGAAMACGTLRTDPDKPISQWLHKLSEDQSLNEQEVVTLFYASVQRAQSATPSPTDEQCQDRHEKYDAMILKLREDIGSDD